MTDRIPDELLREAREIAQQICDLTGTLIGQDCIDIIARALWAERKRCAEIAERELVDIYEDSPEIDRECNDLARRIATAILGGADE